MNKNDLQAFGLSICIGVCTSLIYYIGKGTGKQEAYKEISDCLHKVVTSVKISTDK